jgi:hypothetical protein
MHDQMQMMRKRLADDLVASAPRVCSCQITSSIALVGCGSHCLLNTFTSVVIRYFVVLCLVGPLYQPAPTTLPSKVHQQPSSS